MTLTPEEFNQIAKKDDLVRLERKIDLMLEKLSTVIDHFAKIEIVNN